jgi:hypothetical protein
MGLSLIGWILSLIALQSLPLFAVQAIASSSIGIVVLLDWARTRRPLPRSQIALLVVLGAGLVALAVSAQPSGPGTIPSAFDVAIWISVVVLAAVWLLLDRTGAGARTSVLLGTVSGLAYGGTSLCARALETDSTVASVLLDPLTVALVPFAVIGIGSFAGALQRGSVAIVAACQHASMTVVPSAVGLLCLGDSARDGFEPLAIAGFVLTLGTVVALTFVKPARAADAVVPAV